MFYKNTIIILTFIFILNSFCSAQEAFHESEGGLIIQIKDNLIENLSGDFSATFQATPVKDVFRIFAMQSGLNIMVSPNINASVTANFNKVGIKDAFLAILTANNLYYLVQGSIVKILTSREYKYELLRQYVITKTYDASIIDIKNLAAVLKPMLSPDIGTFTIDAQSSKIIVMDIKDNFERLDNLFKEISSLPKSVEIEAKVIEIALGKGTEMGINWSAVNIGNAINVNVNLPPQNASNLIVALGGGEMVTIGGGQIFNNISANAIIAAISTKNKTTLLSQPKILAINRQEATIHIGENVPYIKSVINSTTAQQTTSQVDFIPVGIRIIVTPMITTEDEVKMDIKAEFSSQELQDIGNGEKAPLITTTEITCEPIVRDEQTVIIGGLIESSKTTSRKGIPLLMDIPFLGYLFSHNSDVINRTERAIFLTPHILKDGKSNIGFKNNSIDMLKEAEVYNTNTNITGLVTNIRITNGK